MGAARLAWGSSDVPATAGQAARDCHLTRKQVARRGWVPAYLFGDGLLRDIRRKLRRTPRGHGPARKGREQSDEDPRRVGVVLREALARQQTDSRNAIVACSQEDSDDLLVAGSGSVEVTQ
jgi:hypothetical protein